MSNLESIKDNDLMPVESVNAVELYKEDGMKDVVKYIKEQVDSLDLSIETNKDRSNVASVAYKIARSKTFLDNLGKDLKAEAQAEVKSIDSVRKAMREDLEALQLEVREPLNKYEADIKAKEAEITALMITFEEFGVLVNEFNVLLTSTELSERLNTINGISISEEFFGDSYLRAVSILEASRKKIDQGLEVALVREAEAKELEELRLLKQQKEEEERQAVLIEQAKADAERKLQAKIDEERRIERDQAEAKRQNELAELAEAQRIVDEKNRLINERIEAEKQIKAREEADKLARERDVEHKRLIHNKAKNDLMACGFNEEMAVAIVKNIVANNISNVTITY